MLTEEEKRLHRCCFSAHRPEKLEEPEEQIKAWLETQICAAISSGFTTFISGCAMGVDIWAGQIVIRLRDEEKVKKGSSSLRLIAATPWPGFSNRWSIDWQEQYSHLLRDADLSVPIANHYSKDVFQKRNEWMVDHSNRVIAYYNGAPGGTRDAIEYAEKKGVEVITNNPDYKPKERKQKKAVAEKIAYPENLVTDIGLNLVFDDGVYQELTADQIDGLDHALSTILPREKDIILLRYQEQKTLQEIGDQYGVTKERIRQIVNKALRKLRHQSRIVLIKNGYKDGELKLKIECAEEIKKQLQVQKKRYPEMNEEDVVKFVFQGMLGNGHLVKNVKVAEERLRAELEVLEADKAEPLIEKISTDWVRMNLRRAKADGLKVEDIAWYLVRSAEWGALSFKRQNVYNFSVKMDGSEAMKATAGKVLDENWLPSHSEAYKEAYKPAYRVLYKDYRKFKKGESPVIKVLFVCHGNICRSAAAEMVMKQMVRERGISGVRIASAAATREEIGNDIYPPMKRALQAAGYACEPHAARQTVRADYDQWDCIIGMDDENMWDMRRIYGNDPEGKLSMLLSWAGKPGQEIGDPWYTRDFAGSLREIEEGCEGLIREIIRRKQKP